MNYYENFVSIHNITNSTDLRDLIFPVPVSGFAYATWCWVLRSFPHKLAQKGGNCLLIGLPVTSS